MAGRRDGDVSFCAVEAGRRLRNLRLLVEYDGTEFSGWQFQPRLRTVQGALEEAISTVLREKIRVRGAGRTDSGCHARGQVASVVTASDVSCQRLLRSLAGLLPADVAVHEVREAALDFDPRRGAVERWYTYRILQRPSPMWRRYAWYPGFQPPRERLEEAVRPLLGDHVFLGFAGADPDREGDPGRCIVHSIEWREWQGGLELAISANRYLYHMVRNIVGTSVKIARGYFPPERTQELLVSGDRRHGGPTAPPQGVCLERVIYHPEIESQEGDVARWSEETRKGLVP